MTLLPRPEQHLVETAAGPKYKVGPRCAHPRCSKFAEHAHHMWRRSFTKGDHAWIDFNGVRVQNLVGLCFDHHHAITDNFARIYFDDVRFLWYDRIDDGHVLTFLESVEAENSKPSSAWLFSGELEPQPQVGDTVVVTEHDEEHCPTCGKLKHKPKEELPPGEKRPKAQWGFTVPKDERENGSEVLDALLAEAAVILGREEHKSWKYYTLVEALAQFVQHGHLMVSNG